jgi:hypothetical protein
MAQKSTMAWTFQYERQTSWLSIYLSTLQSCVSQNKIFYYPTVFKSTHGVYEDDGFLLIIFMGSR